MRETPENRNLGVLEYHTPTPRQWPGGIRWLINAGPWWIVPSRQSGLLIVLLTGTIIVMRYRPAAWTLSQQYSVLPSGYPDYDATYRPMPLHDAVFCVDANGCPIVWRPWNNQNLLRLPFPTSFPKFGSYFQWLGTSRDESKLLAETGGATLLWDTGSGALLHQLTGGTSPWLPERDLDRFINIYFAALSSDGARLATLAGNRDADEDLVTWDITGASAHKLARRTLLKQTPAYDDVVDFSPDGNRLLLASRYGATLLDVDTLSAAFNIPAYGRHAFQWLHYGKQLIIGDSQRGSPVSVYDCQTGQPLVSPPAHSGSGRIALSPDEKRAFVANQYSQPSPLIDLDSSALIDLDSSAVHLLPGGLPSWGCATFFPDSRRLVVSSGDGAQPAIFDCATGSMVASLHLPPPKNGNWFSYPPTVGLLVSADGQHIAAEMDPGQVAVYDHTGSESRYGLMGSPRFALMGVLVLATSFSLWHDAARPSPSSKRSRTATGMVVLSLLPLIAICGWLGIRPSPDLPSQPPVWPIALFALWFPAGLCIRAGSRGWSSISIPLLFLSCVVASLSVVGMRGFGQTQCRVFDREMLLSAWLVFPVCVVAITASAVLLFILLADRAPARSRWW